MKTIKPTASIPIAPQVIDYSKDEPSARPIMVKKSEQEPVSEGEWDFNLVFEYKDPEELTIPSSSATKITELNKTNGGKGGVR